MTPGAITSIFILGIIVGILLCLAWVSNRRREGYKKWIHDWERVEWTQGAWRNGSEKRVAGDEFMIKVQFAWKGIAAKHILEMVEAEMKKRVGHSGVVKVEVLRRKGGL